VARGKKLRAHAIPGEMATPRALCALFHFLGGTNCDATSARLFAFALRRLFRREWVEEVLQERFVNIWNNASS
jgi:hypothetical protein